MTDTLTTKDLIQAATRVAQSEQTLAADDTLGKEHPPVSVPVKGMDGTDILTLEAMEEAHEAKVAAAQDISQDAIKAAQQTARSIDAVDAELDAGFTCNKDDDSPSR